jgi:hypothetical protein
MNSNSLLVLKTTGLKKFLDRFPHVFVGRYEVLSMTFHLHALAGCFQHEERIRIHYFEKLEIYLQKINSISNSIRVLVKAAVSPQCRNLFSFKFEVKYLPELSSKVANIAQSAEDWEKVLETALAHSKW